MFKEACEGVKAIMYRPAGQLSVWQDVHYLQQKKDKCILSELVTGGTELNRSEDASVILNFFAQLSLCNHVIK